MHCFRFAIVRAATIRHMNSRSMRCRALLLICCAAALPMLAASRVPKAQDAPAPAFSVAGGVFAKEFKLELKADSGVIHFSTANTDPTLESPVYQRPIDITNCVTIRAKTWYPDGRVSRTVSQCYTVLADDLREFSSNLPLVIANSGDREITSGDKVLTALHFIENKQGRTTLLGTADFCGLAALNQRGHSSLRYPKHSYSVKLVKESMDGHKVAILGMPKDSDWVLYGPYPDKTLLRDVLAYDLSRQMGHWAPHSRFVEVFINETATKLSMDNYAGVYVLEEKITAGKSRVDITKLDADATREPELTGGYIFKKDHSSSRDRKNFGAAGPPQAPISTNRTGYPSPPGGFPADPAGFLPPYEGTVSARRAATNRTTRATSSKNLKVSRAVTNYIPAAVPEVMTLDDTIAFPEDEGFHTALQKNFFYFYEPEPDEITGVQRAWLKDYVNRLEAALYGPDFTDAKKGYRAFIDADSFIDYHIFSEVTKNVDAFRFSTFYYKDRGGLLKMGPVWDWNLSFGNADGKQGWMPEHWLWPQLDDQQYSWFRRLFEDPDFGQRYVDRLTELRGNVFSTSKVLARIDAFAAQLKESQERNFRKWDIIGRDVTPNYFVGNSYQEEIDWMKDWTSNRLAWIETQFPAAPVVQVLKDSALSLSTVTPEAKIYYTLIGIDPRAAGGKISPEAIDYKSAVTRPKNAKLFARTLVGTRWSAPLVILAE
jgi:hypothetical protein